MRISETKLVQLVESNPPVVVIIDEAAGQEMVFNVAEFDLLKSAVHYFHPYVHRMLKDNAKEQMRRMQSQARVKVMLSPDYPDGPTTEQDQILAAVLQEYQSEAIWGNQ